MPQQLREAFFKRLQDISVRQNLLKSLFIAGLLTSAGCGQTDRMNAYPEFIDLFPVDMARFPPVIVVGRILACVPVGSPRPSIWDGETPYQEYRTTIALENVLNGNVQTPTADVYFLKNLRSGGLKELGTLQNGGYWRIGDREMFFLQHDSGRLRTVCDTFAHCVVPVLSGWHQTFRRNANVGESVADILFTRGRGASDAQMIEGLEYATSVGSHFAPEFSMRKLEEIIQTETPLVRQAACKYLRMFSRSAPYNSHQNATLLTDDANFINAIQSCPAEKDRP